jgi:hypothetical protein
MVGQILPNNNESATGIFPQKISDPQRQDSAQLNSVVFFWFCFVFVFVFF